MKRYIADHRFSGYRRTGNLNVLQYAEKAVFQTVQAQRNAAEQIGADDDTGQQFAQYRGHFDFFAEIAAEFGCEHDYAQLQCQNGYLLGNRETEV